MTVELPPFDAADPRVWFIRVEALLDVYEIHSQLKRAQTVISQLPYHVLIDVTDIAQDPGPTPFDTLKDRLISIYAESDERWVLRLLEDTHLDNQKPSQLLLRMRAIAGGNATPALLKVLWLRALPPLIRSIVASSTEPDLNKLAFIADRVMEAELITRPPDYVRADTHHQQNIAFLDTSSLSSTGTRRRPPHHSAYRTPSRPHRTNFYRTSHRSKLHYSPRDSVRRENVPVAAPCKIREKPETFDIPSFWCQPLTDEHNALTSAALPAAEVLYPQREDLLDNDPQIPETTLQGLEELPGHSIDIDENELFFPFSDDFFVQEEPRIDAPTPRVYTIDDELQSSSPPPHVSLITIRADVHQAPSPEDFGAEVTPEPLVTPNGEEVATDGIITSTPIDLDTPGPEGGQADSHTFVSKEATAPRQNTVSTISPETYIPSIDCDNQPHASATSPIYVKPSCDNSSGNYELDVCRPTRQKQNHPTGPECCLTSATTKTCFNYNRGISTLKRWAGRLDLKSGVLHDVLRMMRIAARDLSDSEKLCVLSFDEMKVQETLEYDEHDDTVVGPHRQMQVAMARSLIGKWKQPVFIAFDVKMTDKILIDLIMELINCGYKVVSLVSDCGGGNVGLWEKLGITYDKPFFLHPLTENKIIYMPDVPHLLKLLRNWFLDKGFLLQDGSIINKKPVEELMKIVNTEITVCPKLKETHITCQKSQRQNVALAAQLISHTVGSALVRYTPGEDKQLSANTGRFLKLMNMCFDLMNVRIAKKSSPSKSPFGLLLEEHTELLNEVAETVKGMRCTGKEYLQTFQKGILMTCKGLPLLLENLKQDGVKYILTHKPNQDSLENLFGQIRTKGGLYDHPSPLNALYRLRTILLGKNPGMVSVNTNILPASEVFDEEDYILVNVLKQAKVNPSIPDIEIPVIPSIGLQLLSSSASDESSSSSDESPSSSPRTTDKSVKEALEEEASKDGLQYIAGWLAFKFNRKYPELTDKTKSFVDHSYSLPPWIKQLSLGGLTSPSTDFAKKVILMEKYFLKLSKTEDYLKKKNIVAKTTKILKKKKNLKDLPVEVLKKFAKLRVIIKMRYTLHTEAELFRKRKLALKLKEATKRQKLMT